MLCDRSWIFIFGSWKSHGNSMLKKRGHPGRDTPAYINFTLELCSFFTSAKEVMLLGYWCQRADERYGNPPPR